MISQTNGQIAVVEKEAQLPKELQRELEAWKERYIMLMKSERIKVRVYGESRGPEFDCFGPGFRRTY